VIKVGMSVIDALQFYYHFLDGLHDQIWIPTGINKVAFACFCIAENGAIALQRTDWKTFVNNCHVIFNLI